jgi:acetyl-CoA carboxylase carboxyl transferase subunit beta
MGITLAAGAIVTADDGRFLLVLRADPPEAGRWSVPGGKVEPGETFEAAAAREVLEETGVTVRIDRELGALDRSDGRGGTYEIHDFAATWVSGEPAAADDAADARWFTAAEVAQLPLTRDLLGVLTRYGLYP